MSKHLFDNAEFQEANWQLNSPGKKKKRDWQHVWHDAADPKNPKPKVEKVTNANAFRFVKSA